MSRDDPSTIVAVPFTDRGKDADLRALEPALTIVWHPDLRRVGESAPLGKQKLVEISRKTLPFDAGTDVALSRATFLEVRARARGVELHAPSSSTTVEVGGRLLAEPLDLSSDELRSGVIVTLGGALVVCLHSVRVPVLRGPSLGLVGDSDAIEVVRRQISKVVDLDVSVLIRGETGTGKELVARAIRSGSSRAERPFVAINMGAVPSSTAADELFGHEKGAFTGASDARAGYFGEADGGMLFLDEIGATPPDVQKMLLRTLETGEIRPLGGRRARKVDVRVLAATDEDLEAAARAGTFSEPLLHRLSGYSIHLPPLRERRQDVGLLFLHFLRKELDAIGEGDRLDPRASGSRPWLSAGHMARIAGSRFAGNVRALRNLARQLVISSRGQDSAEIDETVTRLLSDWEAPRATDSGGERSKKVSDEEIAEALRRHNYNHSATAAALGINRATLYERLHRNPHGVRAAASLTDDEILVAHDRHAGDIAAMAADLRVSPKPLKARLSEALARRGSS